MSYRSIINSNMYDNWQEIDVIVSRDCILRCKYCYLDKKKDEGYDLEKIIESLDSLLKHIHEKPNVPGVIFGLYPEPWFNISRTNEIMLRILEMLLKYPRFISNYMFSLGTCGSALHKEIPIIKHIPDHVSVQVTIDGIKEQHDKYRVFPNGSPSWDIIKKNILDQQAKYNIYSTKVTLGPDTIKYIYDSTLFLWNEMNFSDVNMNVVFENLWGSKLDKIKTLKLFEEQLFKLTDYIISNKIYKTKYISLLGEMNISHSKELRNSNYCGAAVMRSIDSDGSIYPCFRLSPYSLDEDKTFKIETKNNKFENSEIERTLKLLNTYDSSPEKCINCEILNSCSMCVGGAYEEGKSLFHRTTHHCEFIKLQHKYAKIIEDEIKREVI